jgi:hypothetical protein
MKVGDIVKRASPQNAQESAGRYVLVEHHGTEGTIRLVGDAPSHAGQRIALSELVLAENAPLVVDPADD